MEEEKIDVASLALTFTEKTDGVNKRLTCVLISLAVVFAIVVIAFCIRDGFIAHTYFASTYDYATINNAGGNVSNAGGNIND